MDRAEVRAQLDDALGRHDRAEAVSRALRYVDDGSITIPELYEVLAEILVDLGSAWQTGAAEVWQEHLVTGVARTIVEACALRVDEAAPSERAATVVLAAPSDEYHDLGLRMLADRFTLAGWRAHFLGANVPAAELVKAVAELDAEAVALSASTHLHRVSLERYVSLLGTSRPDLRVWVGGPAFAHEHDGWAAEMVLDPRRVPQPGGP